MNTIDTTPRSRTELHLLQCQCPRCSLFWDTNFTFSFPGTVTSTWVYLGPWETPPSGWKRPLR